MLFRSRLKSVYTEQFLAKCKTWGVDEDKPFHDFRFEVNEFSGFDSLRLTDLIHQLNNSCLLEVKDVTIRG